MKISQFFRIIKRVLTHECLLLMNFKTELAMTRVIFTIVFLYIL